MMELMLRNGVTRQIVGQSSDVILAEAGIHPESTWMLLRKPGAPASAALRPLREDDMR